MAASQHKLKMQNPQDKWTLREQLCLASAVLRSGDQNWVSVSRAVKPLAEPGLQRPPDFYSQKNCASQYSTLLEQVEAPKRKRGNQGEVESHCEMIARKLTMERIEELKRLVRIDQQNYRRLKAELIKVKSGELDHQLKDMWNEIQAKKKASEEALEAQRRAQEEAEAAKAATQGQKGKRPMHQIRQQAPQHLSHLQLPAAASSSAAAQERPADAAPETVEGEPPTAPLPSPLPSPNLPPQQQDAVQTPTKTTSYQKQPPPSPLLSSLLKTKHQELAQQGLTQAPLEHDHSSVPQPLPPLTIPPTSQHSMLEGSGVMPAPLQSPAAAVGQSQVSPAATAVPSSPSAEMVSNLQSTASQPVHVMTMTPPATRQQTPAVSSSPPAPVAAQQQPKVKQEPVPEPQLTSQTSSSVPSATPTPSTPQIKEEARQVVQEEVVRVKEEPVSQIEATPTAKVDEVKETPRSAVKRKGQRGRPRGSRRGTRSRARQEPDEGDREGDPVEGSDTGDPGKEDTRSEVEYSESEDGRPQDSDDNSSISAAGPHPLAASFQSDSLPSSPASFSQCDDQETLKAERAWRKAIMMVWRAAASHKYANVFLHPVTDDQAPGYHSIVFRPMDLSTIKKNIETGLIRTTAEFQRDIMLMFQNAIMYNNSDHDVYHMAVEMQRDVMQQIQQFLATQLMVQTADTGKTQLRLRETTRRPEDQQRRGSSEEGGPGKKRRRADDLT
ncbi:bromodomain-containing protein 8-like isoform X17 [Branchiostoma floridae x Branchiostoma belcheri]